MDFFAAEERAKKRTRRLLALFGLAVAGTIALGYAGAVWMTWALGHQARHSYRAYSLDNAPIAWWQPHLLLAVSAATLAVVAIASLYKWAEFSQGGSAVAESVGARVVDPKSTDPLEHRLLNVVEEMAIASGVHMPAVYILDDENAINAFAAGLTSNDAVVTVTRGAMQKLSRDELQGVIGHEFSHILNGDMRTNVRLSALIFGILVIGLSGRAILWSLRGARPSRNEKGNGVAVLIAVGVGLLILGYVGYFFGRLIQAAISRQREFLADASSVQFTRNPAGISGALKKIGGYALGSSLDTHKAADIGHFFFAQAFLSSFGGLWATHPPLSERIKAIEPSFDGKYFEPPEVVDVTRQPWSSVPGDAPRPAPAPADPKTVNQALAAIGMISAQAVSGAQDMLAQIPESVRAAARSPESAPALVYGLLLDADPEVRSRQRACVAAHAGAEALRLLDDLAPALAQTANEHRLPLVQLAMPALKTLPSGAISSFADTLDELIRADGKLSTFEFALQKVILRGLAANKAPSKSIVQIYSFQAVATQISIILSALAHAASDDAGEAQRAFTSGASQLKLLEGKLALLPAGESTLEKLDQPLDTLASSSGPIKQRLLMAGAHVVSADGCIHADEAELLRAIATVLDVPMPPLSVT